jgi:fluoroquinolone transport system permease protein
MPTASMPSITAVRGMLRTDALRLRRDRFLIGISIYILAITVVMRWLLPEITTAVASEWEFDLIPYHPLIVSYWIVQTAPLIPGIIGAFMLLESREDGTVKALFVSPNPLSSYVSVVCVVMLVTAVSLTLAQGAIIALALPPWPALIAVGLAAAPAAPIFAFLVASFAENKVQAFAYMKIFGLGPTLVLGAYFLPEPWQWLAAIYPPYCASKAYWIAEAGGSQWPLWVLGGLVGSVVWVVVLQRLYLDASRK